MATGVAWVLVFNGWRKDKGVYCLHSGGCNVVLAFARRDEALRYAAELQAQGLQMPNPSRITLKDLQHFCDNHGFGLKVVPQGVALVPPDESKPGLEYDLRVQAGDEPHLRLGSVLTRDDFQHLREGFERLYRQQS